MAEGPRKDLHLTLLLVFLRSKIENIPITGFLFLRILSYIYIYSSAETWTCKHPCKVSCSLFYTLMETNRAGELQMQLVWVLDWKFRILEDEQFVLGRNLFLSSSPPLWINLKSLLFFFSILGVRKYLKHKLPWYESWELCVIENKRDLAFNVLAVLSLSSSTKCNYLKIKVSALCCNFSPRCNFWWSLILQYFLIK